ncbi:uncharacterized protein LOC131697535 [Acipenser ruthenus]|uniref:uncharacterized protein LOC131697535 n=1 Tax=Acipenser ruthenus TaxID=7906 RepID=UPI00145BB5C6|nr:uncharacterized protein LOC131697535 [Acipenser ruthenus]
MENASPRGFILCACGKHRYASTDSHGSCMHCLGLEHAKTSVSERGKCPHCAKFQRRACHKRLSKVRKFLNQMTSDKKTIPPDPKPLKPVVSTPAKVTLPTVMKKSLQTDAPSQPSMVLFSSLSTATSTLTPQSSTIPMVFTIRSPASTSSMQHVAPVQEPKRENNTGTERHSSNSGSKSHSHRGSHKRRHSSERRSRHFRQSQHARRSHGLSHARSNSPSSSYTSYSSSSDCFSPKKENSSRLLARFSDMLKKQREQLLDVMHLQLQALQQSMQAQRDSMEQRVEALEKKQKKFLSAPSVMQTQSLGSTQDTDFAHDDTFRLEAEPTCKDWSGSTASMDSDTITVKIEEDPISIVSGYDIEEEGDDEDNGDSEDASLLPDVTPSMQELLLADDLQSLICRAAEYLGIDFPAVPGRLTAPDPTMVPEFENLVQSTWSNPASSRPFKEVHSKMYSLHECQAPAYDRMPQVSGLMSAIFQAVKPTDSKEAPVPTKQWRFTEALAERVYQTAGMLARTANYLRYLSDYQTRLLDEITGEAPAPRLQAVLNELKLIAQFSLQLSSHQAELSGRAMACSVAIRRQVWMANAKYTDALKATVADLPFVVGHTFGPHVDAAFNDLVCKQTL